MIGNLDEFDQGIRQIGINNASEINGDLKDYFSVSKREDDTYKIKWEKNISTHIRHKVTKLVKEYYVVEPVKAVHEPVKEVLVPAKKVSKPVKAVLEPAKKVPKPVKKVVEPVKEVLESVKPVKATVKKTVKAK